MFNVTVWYVEGFEFMFLEQAYDWAAFQFSSKIKRLEWPAQCISKMQVSLRYALRERAAQLASIWASFGNQRLPETQQICLNYLQMLPWLSVGHFILVAACFMSVVLSPACGAEYVFSCCLVIPGASQGMSSITPLQLGVPWWPSYQDLGSVFMGMLFYSWFFWEPVATWSSKVICKTGTMHPGRSRLGHHSKTLTHTSLLQYMSLMHLWGLDNFFFSDIQGFCFLLKMLMLWAESFIPAAISACVLFYIFKSADECLFIKLQSLFRSELFIDKIYMSICWLLVYRVGSSFSWSQHFSKNILGLM